METIDDYDYNVPKELIAQKPSPKKKHRLLVYNKKHGTIEHKMFEQFGNMLSQGDVVVVNNTKVYPAKVNARKRTGAKIELLFVRPVTNKKWHCLVKGRRVKTGDEIILQHNIGKVMKVSPKDYDFIIEFSKPLTIEHLKLIGKTPLPPYIKKDAPLNRYQTLFAKSIGSIAAPTAGFHFSKELVSKMKSKGIKFAEICLHVGIGTFAPVRCMDYKQHIMHSEFFTINKKNADNINKRKGNLYVVGTTTMRALETVTDATGMVHTGKGQTKIYIYPGYKFKTRFKGFITNFHIPKSTLILMVATIIGRNELFRIYNKAVKEKYMFYSFGDAMMIIVE